MVAKVVIAVVDVVVVSVVVAFSDRTVDGMQREKDQ